MNRNSDDLRLRLANMRRALTAPAASIVGYAELLSESAGDAGLGDFEPDLERIRQAATQLHGMVDALVEQGALDKILAEDNLEEAQRHLRHDLRTPINAIKGYAEMLAEDLQDDGGPEDLLADFHRIIGEADTLLASLDQIVRNLEGGEEDTAAGGADEQEMAVLAELISQAPERGLPERTGKILVVDDIEANRDVLSRRLTRDGHEVATASGGIPALEMMGRENFDVVLLDLMMPDMNGLEVLQRVRADEALRDVPVIVVSAIDEVDSAIRCIEAGAEDYLPKPANPVLLRARLNACLERQAWRAREQQYLADLQVEKDKSDQLLLNILPGQIIQRLNDGEQIIADRFEDVAVLMADIVGFTSLTVATAPTVMVRRLNRLFSDFDALTREFGVEKIKTIGDAYLAVAGLPEPHDDAAGAVARMALAMMQAAETQNETETPHLRLRIGLHHGPVIAGIIGTHKFVYDIWGDTVNMASRMEALSLSDHIHMTGAMTRHLGKKFDYESRGTMAIKGIGRLETFFLNGEN